MLGENLTQKPNSLVRSSMLDTLTTQMSMHMVMGAMVESQAPVAMLAEATTVQRAPVEKMGAKVVTNSCPILVCNSAA